MLHAASRIKKSKQKSGVRFQSQEIAKTEV